MSSPPSRHADVLATLWIVVGTALFPVLCLTQATTKPYWLSLFGAVGAVGGHFLARAMRPHLRFTEAAVAIVLALLVIPAVTRWGAVALDRDALIVLGVGAPLGLGMVWLRRDAAPVAPRHAEVYVALAVMTAAFGLALVLFGLTARRIDVPVAIDVALATAGLAGGASLGATVARTRWYHAGLGAALTFALPPLLGIGVMRVMPLHDLLEWSLKLGGPGTLGWLAGRQLRRRALARSAGAALLPTARVVDGDARDR